MYFIFIVKLFCLHWLWVSGMLWLPMPEAPEIQQLSSKAKTFAKFLPPNIRIIYQLCLTPVTEDAPKGYLHSLSFIRGCINPYLINLRSCEAGNSLCCFCSAFQWYVWWGEHFACIRPGMVTASMKETWRIIATFFLISRVKSNSVTYPAAMIKEI